MLAKRNICIVDTVYVLLIYLLLVEDDVIENTNFLTTPSIPRAIQEKIPVLEEFELEQNQNKFRLIFRVIIIRLKFLTIWRKLTDSVLYGQDHLWFASPTLASLKEKKMIVIEDGLGNYVLSEKVVRFKRLKSFLFGGLRVEAHMGHNQFASKVILTKDTDLYADNIKSVINLKDRWNQIADSRKHLIYDIFDFDKSIVSLVKEKEILLITQPLSEDGIVSEAEKINIYLKALNGLPHEKVVIKTHPREQTDYSNIFPDISIIEDKFPIELLTFIGISFNLAITYYSTAIYAFGHDVEKVFLNKALLNKLSINVEI